MKSITKIILAASVIAFFLLSNCKKDTTTNSSNNNPIVGKWGFINYRTLSYNNGTLLDSTSHTFLTTDTDYVEVTFNANNTYLDNSPNSSTYAHNSGTYSINNNKITLIQGPDTSNGTYAISGNNMTMTITDASAPYTWITTENFVRK